MADLYDSLDTKVGYYDKKIVSSYAEWLQLLKNSTTVYVGNLSFYTSEDTLYELFSKCGKVKNIIMGLNPKKKQPCGFCFVVFYSHKSAERAVSLLNQSLCDGRVIRIDLDIGIEIDDTRRFARGTHGLQWRDEFRAVFDNDRGGYGGASNEFSVIQDPTETNPINDNQAYRQSNFNNHRKRQRERHHNDQNIPNNDFITKYPRSNRIQRLHPLL